MTAIGQIPHRSEITAITNSIQCEVTTAENHGFETFDFVRLTDLNGAMPAPRGEDPLNNHRYRIVVTGETTFKLQDPITHKWIDSTNYPPYVEGGSCNKIEPNFIFYGEEE
jgi:hypothetical protein